MQWEIRKAITSSEPEAGKLYRDRDNDLFFYLGEDVRNPWLEITSDGASRRADDFPNGPLTELEVKDYGEAITEKLRRY